MGKLSTRCWIFFWIDQNFQLAVLVNHLVEHSLPGWWLSFFRSLSCFTYFLTFSICLYSSLHFFPWDLVSFFTSFVSCLLHLVSMTRNRMSTLSLSNVGWWLRRGVRPPIYFSINRRYLFCYETKSHTQNQYVRQSSVNVKKLWK